MEVKSDASLGLRSSVIVLTNLIQCGIIWSRDGGITHGREQRMS